VIEIGVGMPQTLNGVIFSDLGLASKFMALEWVRQALSEALGFAPFPATLNVHPADDNDARNWQTIRNDPSFFSHMPPHEGSCAARIYRIALQRSGSSGDAMPAAVLLPEVRGYPTDKIEIVAPVRLKDTLSVQDGDLLTLEFFH
jgi:riboflavin kinase